MSAARLALHQLRFDQKTFWRNPAAVFFTVALPLIFLVIFSTVFGNEPIEELGGITTVTYYVPAIITLAVVSATMQSLAIALTIARENGILKRGRGTPMPSLLPLYFISGIFIPESEVPDGVLQVADFFPVRHFFEAFFTAFDPNTAGAGFEWGDLAVLAGWGLLGFGVAVKFFRWTPRAS